MKEYCVDLDIAKELKKNGFPQKSEFLYEVELDGKYILRARGYEIIIPHEELCIVKDSINNIFWCGYEGKTLNDELAATNKKLSNALAKLWLYLKQEGYLNERVNENKSQDESRS